MKRGFVYIWMDTDHRKFYIGSHVGEETDGYIGSGLYFRNAYNKRPDSFKRRILERIVFNEYKELQIIEERWLTMIDDKELGVKYYNLKKFAAGGNIIGSLSEEKRNQHKKRSLNARKKGWDIWIKQQTNEQKSINGKYARSFVKNPSGGRMPGELNPFYGKTHNENTKSVMSEKAQGRTNNIKRYRIVFPNGETEWYTGQQSISDKYNTNECKIKFTAFIDTDMPIKSNRKTASNHPLLEAKIYSS